MITVSPFNGVLSRMNSLSRAMDDVVGRTDEYSNGSGQYFIPAMDAWETEQAFVVQLDLPGVNADQVDVSFDRNTLAIKGTRGATLPPAEQGEKRVFFAERTPGQFARTLRFPKWVDASRIEAKFADGVLTVTVPKSEAAKPRKIQISN
jgi:HSP20 family protein